jgi:hypothetical protein
MDNSLDETTLSTISLLESRLLRVEHLIYGPSATPPRSEGQSVATSLADLDRRFASLLPRIRVYGELIKLCTLYDELCL